MVHSSRGESGRAGIKLVVGQVAKHDAREVSGGEEQTRLDKAAPGCLVVCWVRYNNGSGCDYRLNGFEPRESCLAIPQTPPISIVHTQSPHVDTYRLAIEPHKARRPGTCRGRLLVLAAYIKRFGCGLATAHGLPISWRQRDRRLLRLRPPQQSPTASQRCSRRCHWRPATWLRGLQICG